MDILWAAIHHYRTYVSFLPKGCSSQFPKLFETYYLSYQRDKFVKTVVQPSSSLREHHLLQPSWRCIFSTPNNQKTRVDSHINSDYKASSFDRLHIWHRKWETVGFIREILKCAHRRPRPWWRWLQLQPSCDSPQCCCNHICSHIDSHRPILADTLRNNNFIITSNRCFDVVLM